MSPSSVDPVFIGVGIDTARYGHRVSFLRADRQPAAKPFTFRELHSGYAELRQALQQLQERYGHVHFLIRIDVAGQYAANLERFVRSLPFDKTVSMGEPKRNRDYCKVHFPKRKSDDVDAQACARFAVVEQPKATPEIPAAFVPLRELVSALESQIKHETRLQNQLHNRLARVFPELALVVSNLSAAWVLRLFVKYPTPAKIAAARLSSLLAIPHLNEERAQQIQAAARNTVASVQGPLIEHLIRQAVQALQYSRQNTARLKALLEQAYEALPPGPHQQIASIPGIGKATAAVLVAKLVGLDHFDSPEKLVGYFGVFPEESTSGVDKQGRPLPPGTMVMSRKGNDLVRRYLWCAAWAAVVHNPVLRRFYARLRGKGKRGDVALGHCMRKLLHLVFAVWKTGRPFVAPQEPAAEGMSSVAPEKAVGRKGHSPEQQAVTTASATIPLAQPACNAPPTPAPPPRSKPIDFAELRRHLSMEQVLRELHWWDRLQGRGVQRRGPCPIHASAEPRSRVFSVNLQKNLFRCFEASCGAQGNVLDLWAQKHRLSLLQAARDLAERFPHAAATEKRNP